MASSALIALAGIGLAWRFFGGGVREPARRFVAAWPHLTAAVRGKFFVDEIYDWLVVRPLRGLSRGFFLVVDRILIDKLLVGGGTVLVDTAGRLLRLVQVGDVQRYLAIFAIGLAALVYVMARPAAPSEVKVRIEGRSATVDLGDGEAAADKLEYGFDFDGDGREDRVGAVASANWLYPRPGHYQLRVRITDPRWNTSRTIARTIDIR